MSVEGKSDDGAGQDQYEAHIIANLNTKLRFLDTLQEDLDSVQLPGYVCVRPPVNFLPNSS